MMKRKFRNYFPVFLIIVLSGLLLSVTRLNNNTSGTLKAGAAIVKITPADPVRMSGYAARSEPFKGVHDDLFASAVVFENSTTKACIITADVIGFSHDFVDETKQLIRQDTGIPEENILITAVHNHGGPRTRAYGEEPTANEKAYVKTLQENLVKIATESNKGLQPVQVGVGKGTCTMNVNRRARHAEGGVWLGRNPGGICDQEVGVIRVDDLSGKTIAILANWPCHATTGGQENYQITGDWPGAASRGIKKAFPDAVILMSAGASGDINPIYGPNDSFNDIDAIGQTLADEVVDVCQGIETYPLQDLQATSMVIRAAGKKPSESRMPNVSLEPAEGVDIRVSSLKIGAILIAGISGELMNEIGLKIKEESPYKNTFIYTHCNGNSGYLCTDKAYEEGGYEPMVSRTMPGTEKQISDTFRQMNNKL
ncbi:MAG: neutral/alkaline non-lysosomal ceramidase N-terminal domain-containing protein [Cyclobacteriaceae bacterium]|nr:neutral/alkaline non-lysosomal ceramidase N-terminal domain-containing protein [Cyclobacteriaceae bacterium]